MSLDKIGGGPRWIDQLVKFYKKIAEDPNIPVENLDKANDAILKCIEELRPLTRLTT
uniref:Uncharacterized protein n=1 Tax=viral metagenome TaxID=1070528 RepID=A0A6M3M1H2_9ZZZZ